MRARGDRLMLGVLVLDAALLAIGELLFLPLRVNDLGSPHAMSWLPHALYTWPIPVSILLAALTTPLLVAQAGRYADHTLAVGSPLFCWLLICLVGGVGGPGGDVVLVNDWRSLVFLLAGALGGAAALGRVLGAKALAAQGRPAAADRSAADRPAPGDRSAGSVERPAAAADAERPQSG